MKKSKKNTGSYYTPQRLAEYAVYRLFGEEGAGYNFSSRSIDVLEPSVGGGMFLDAMLNGNYYASKYQFAVPYLNVDAVEIDPKVASVTTEKSGLYDKKKGVVRVLPPQDYLEYFLRSKKKYDLIIGNPPYVRRRNMPFSQRELCAEVHKATGINDVNPKNLWTAFLAGAKESLKTKGVIAFVLPNDLLQVKYSEEIRTMIRKEFERVEIFSFNWLAFKKFDDVEQDVVVLICSNGHGKNDDIQFFHINNLEELEEPKVTRDHDNSHRSTLNKWTNYALTNKEFEFLDSIHKRISPNEMRHFCDSGAGIVTAANDYYIVDWNTVEEYGLQDIAHETIKKSSGMFAAAKLTKKDLTKKKTEGAEIFFLNFPDEAKDKLPKNYLAYLEKCEQDDIHKRYKMLLRDNWYAVPSVWKSEAFFTKRTNIYPRIILNEADAYVTDAFYRIRIHEDYDVENLTFSFYNTFTFIYAELMGRYYGGGVLELTPNEFKGLPLPYIDIGSMGDVLGNLDKMVRDRMKLSDILDFTDRIILQDSFNISDKDIRELRRIYSKLLSRRLKKEKYEI